MIFHKLQAKLHAKLFCLSLSSTVYRSFDQCVKAGSLDLENESSHESLVFKPCLSHRLGIISSHLSDPKALQKRSLRSAAQRERGATHIHCSPVK